MRNLFIIAIVLLFPGIVAAQSSSLFPSSGGSSSSSSSGRSSSSGGGSSMGTGGGGGLTSSSQQGLGGGGGAGGGGGSGTTFGTGELASPEFTQFGQAGEAAMNQEFVGVGQNGTFVGANQATSSSGQQTLQNRQSLQGFGNQGDQQSQGRSTTSSSRSRAERLRPVTRIAFNYEVVSPVVMQTRIDTQLAETQFDIAGLSYSLDGDGVLTLTGVASSVDASRLAETYLGFEPGVRRVDNQIVVNQ